MSTTPSPLGSNGEPIGTFDQPILAIGDPTKYDATHAAIAGAFATPRLEPFLKSLASAGLRIRDFESVLNKGLLGASTRADYTALDNADQGQIREFYLAGLEQVPMDLRNKFFKLYAYY